MPTIYSFEFPNIESIQKSENLDGLIKFKERLINDINEFIKMKEAASERIEKLSKQNSKG